MKFSSGNVVLCSVAGEAALGVGILTNDETIASGQDVDIQIKDIGVVCAGAAIAKGAELAVDANGKFVTATAGQFVVGIALEAATAAGIMIRAQICRLGYKPAAPGTVSMADLTDVDLTGKANGKILKYNSTSTKWECADDAT